MKKLLTLAVILAFAGTAAMAKDDNAGKEFKKNRKEIAKLVEKYNKEDKADKKTAIEKDIQTKVAAGYDAHLAAMEARTTQAKERLAKMEAMLSEAKKPEAKEQHIAKMTQNIIAGKGPFGKDFKKAKKGDKKFKKGKKGFKKGAKACGCKDCKGKSCGKKACSCQAKKDEKKK